MIFRRAILRLATIFTVVQLLLFAGFAAAVYVFVTGAFDFDAAESDGTLGAAEQGFASLRLALVVSYSALIVFVPLASYAMARAALAPLRRSYEAQQSFVDGASHEMRTPLSVIQGELELALSRPRSSEEYRSAIGTTLEAASGLVKLTDDLLMLTRDERTLLTSSFTSVDLDALADAAVRRRPAGESPRVTLAHNAALSVRGSAELLSRALDNLIDNAVKFTDDGSITVAVTAVDGKAVLSVVDTGVGMAPDETAHAAERFWRADAARNRPGHGLGLALVDQIADAHRGRLSVESRAGSGTTASVVLPFDS